MPVDEGQPEPIPGIDLSVVIPAYNESSRLLPTLEEIRRYAASSDHECQLVVVDDGSVDGTGQIVRDFDRGPLHVTLLVNPMNHGKGYSVRRGVMAASGAAILVCDADSDTPIDEIDKLLPFLDDGYDVVIGSRAMPDSVIDPPRPWRRSLASVGFRMIRQRILLKGIRDTQCGFKCFSRDAARQIFPQQTIEGYAFDCEVLALAEKFGYRIREVGVRWITQPDSRVRVFRHGFGMLRDLMAIRRRLATFEPAKVPAAQTMTE